MTSKPQCSKHIYHSQDNWGYHTQCLKPVAIERDGHPYCKLHDPVACTARRKALEEQWDRKHEERRAAEALRQKHERIGRLVCENAYTLKRLTTWPANTAADTTSRKALDSILKEVDA